MESLHFKNESLSAVVLDRHGIIRAVDFKGIAFDGCFGWPNTDIIGQPFMCIHEMHNISKQEISCGVERVCSGQDERFCFRFHIPSYGREVTYELVADHEPTNSEKILVTYEKVSEYSDSEYERKLVNQTNIHEALFRHVPIGIIYQDNRGMIELANPMAQKILGFSQDDLQQITRHNLPWELYDEYNNPLHYEELPGIRCLHDHICQQSVVIGVRRKDGDLVWIQTSAEVVLDTKSKEQTGVLTSFVDITQERSTQLALVSQTERTQMAVESAEMGVWDWVPSSNHMVWDKKLYQLYGYPSNCSTPPEQVWKEALHPEDMPRINKEIRRILKDIPRTSVDYRVVWPNGRTRHLRSQARAVKDSDGRVTRVIGVTHDISNEVMAEKKLWELAYTDTLTGAYSRAGLNFRMSRSVARSLQHDKKFSVLILGLLRFKDINENYGLSAGDKVLVEIARRAKALIKSDDSIARIGGDEFAIVLEGISEKEEIKSYIVNFRKEVLKPVYLNEGLQVTLDASIGVSVFPDDGIDAPSLQTNASLAMRNGRFRDGTDFTRYSPVMSEEVSRKFNLKYQLYSAVKSEEFELYYQPIIDLSCNSVVGCEALIRWKDHEGKFVSPMEFIPVVEESGLIYELGKWINLTAVKQWKLWQQLLPEMQYISVNVSPRQLEHKSFVEDLISMVREHNISPENIQLEITEGTFLQESLNADSILLRLANFGFRLAIDDFGTGYSSLAYLKRFHVDVIKIDRSFIKDIERDKSDRDIVSAILAMNKKLGFKTLVEGVETHLQDQIVHELGCDSAQGYLYGKPTFADEFAEFYISKPIKH